MGMNLTGRMGAAPLTGGTGARACVLVVGADRASREGLRAVLEGDGHVAESAADVWRAVDRIRERPFDVVIVDLDLPPVHGIRLGPRDTIRMLLAAGSSHRLVVVSAEDGLRFPPESGSTRIQAFLEKPISLVELRAVVKSAGESEVGANRRG
jgi:DNA-binding NtrC family response regulator